MNRRPILPRIDLDPGDPPAAHEFLREVFSRWASGVSVVAVRGEAGPTGMTVSAFAPLSLDPPLVLLAIGADAPVLPALRDLGRFTINVLSQEQRRAASVFADRLPVTMPAFAAGKDAVLEDVLCALICEVEAEHEGGDHRIVVGRIVGAVLGDERPPLLHYRRAYRSIE